MFSSLKCCNGPREMQRVRNRDIHCVHLRMRKDVFIFRGHVIDRMLTSKKRGFFNVSASDNGDATANPLDRGHDHRIRNRGCTEYAPPKTNSLIALSSMVDCLHHHSMGDKHSGIDVRLELRSTLNWLSHCIVCFD